MAANNNMEANLRDKTEILQESLARTNARFKCTTCGVGFQDKQFHCLNYDFCTIICMRTKMHPIIDARKKKEEDEKLQETFRKVDMMNGFI
jgi:hypothetical protein